MTNPKLSTNGAIYLPRNEQKLYSWPSEQEGPREENEECNQSISQLINARTFNYQRAKIVTIRIQNRATDSAPEDQNSSRQTETIEQNQDHPLVSIIVPNYNHANYLKERIESILAQDYENFEIIILDDESPDHSKNIIESYRGTPQISHIIYNTKNSGSTFRQWEKGVNLAKGDYLWIAESDDTASPNLLKRLVTELQRSPETVLAYCQSNRMNARGAITGSWLEHTEKLAPGVFSQSFTLDGEIFSERYLIHTNAIPNASAVLFRKQALNQIGGAREIDAYAGCNGDWLLWLKLSTAGKISFIAEPLNNFRYHENSVIAKVAARKASANSRFFSYKHELKLRKRYQEFLSDKRIPPKKFHKVNIEKIAEIIERKSLLRLKSGDYKRATALFMTALPLSPRKLRLTFRFIRKMIKAKILNRPSKNFSPPL